MTQASSGGGRRTGIRSTLGAVLAGLLAVVVWWFQGSGDDTPAPDATTLTPGVSSSVSPGTDTPSVSSTPSPSAGGTQTRGPSATPSAPTATPSASASTKPSVKPSVKPSAPSRAAVDEHGLRYVDAASLPDPAGDVLAAIDAGGPFKYTPKDGSSFGNFEGVLPQQRRGYYREYTVETPGVSHRGARRIVTGAGGEFYWTDDHYASFERIRR